MEDMETKRRGRPPGSGNVRPEAPAMAPADLIEMRVVRDFWNDEGERVVAGSVVNVPVRAALRGVKFGSLDLIGD